MTSYRYTEPTISPINKSQQSVYNSKKKVEENREKSKDKSVYLICNESKR